VEKTNNVQPLLYYIKGPEVLKDRIPLYEVIGTLSEYMNILDRSYLTISHRERLSRKEREKYKVIAYQFAPGSLEVKMAIELSEAVQMGLAFAMPAGAKGLWNVARTTFDYVKTIVRFRSNGVEPIIKPDDQIPGFRVGDNNTVIVNSVININADKIEEAITKISGYIRPGSIDTVALKEPEEPEGDGITFSEEENLLFNPDVEVEKETRKITAAIYRLDVESGKGKLRVLDGMEQIDVGFEIVGKQTIEPYIDALKEKSVEVHVLREVARSFTGKEYTRRFLLVRIEGSGQRFLSF